MGITRSTLAGRLPVSAYDAHRQPLPAHVQGHLHVGAVGVQAGAVRVGVHVPVIVRTIGQGHYKVSFSKFVIWIVVCGCIPTQL